MQTKIYSEAQAKTRYKVMVPVVMVSNVFVHTITSDLYEAIETLKRQRIGAYIEKITIIAENK